MTDIFVQELTVMVNYHVFNQSLLWSKTFVPNNNWDSVCCVVHLSVKNLWAKKSAQNFDQHCSLLEESGHLEKIVTDNEACVIHYNPEL